MPARKIDQPHSSTKEYQRAYYLKYKDRKRMFTPEQIERKRVTVGMVESKQYKLGLIRQYLAEWNAVEFDPKDKPVSVEDR